MVPRQIFTGHIPEEFDPLPPSPIVATAHIIPANAQQITEHR